MPAHVWDSDMEKIVLKNNSICATGSCREETEDDKEGSEATIRCKKNQMDMMEHFNSVFEYLQPSKFKVLVRNNITGAIMIFSIILWVSIQDECPCFPDLIQSIRASHP